MVDGDWININNTLDQMNFKIDLHRVAKVVEAQVDQIADVKNNANKAVSQANELQKASTTNKAAIDNMNSALKDTEQAVSDAAKRLDVNDKNITDINTAIDATKKSVDENLKHLDSNDKDIADINTALKATEQTANDAIKRIDSNDKSIADINTALSASRSDAAVQSTAVANIQTDLANAKQQIKDADGNITAIDKTAKSALSIASDANGNATEAKQTAGSAYAVATDTKSDVVQIKVTADSAVSIAKDANSDVVDIRQTASAAVATANNAKSQLTQIKLTANSAVAFASDANSNAVETKQTADSAYTIAKNASSDVVQVKLTANSAVAFASDANKNVVDIQQTAKSAVAMATDAKSDAAKAALTANGVSTLVTGLTSQVTSLSDTAKAVSDDMKNKADKGTVDQVVSKLTTSINQAKDALTFKADKLDIDKLNKTVTDTQTLLNQKAGELSSTITQVGDKAGQNTTLISNLTQTVDGMQSTVKNKADQSTVSQLANQMLAKVSTKDFQTEIALMQKNLNLRISKGDLISQLNLEAGGNGLIQVANGKGKLYLDADSVVISHKAFIPSAAITDIEADKIKSGTLDAGLMRVINLTADTIHGGTLDVGSMNVKNLSANDITTGTLTGIDIISKGDKGKQYEMIGSTLKWTDDDKHHASIGQNEFSNNYTVDPAAFSLLSDNGVFLGNVRFNDKGEPDVPTLGLDNSSVWINNNGVQIASDAFHVLSIGAGQSYYDTIKGQTYDTQSFEFDTTNAVQINLNPGSINVDQNTGQSTKAWNSDSQFRIQKDDHIGAYFGEGNNGNQITFNFGGNDGGLTVNGSLRVGGSKNSVVQTSQGWLAINAYETAEYYFGDIGESNTGNQSKVTIGIDKIFNETVNTNVQYQVFVTPYSDARVWVEQRYHNRFVVCSDKPNAEFGWEIKAKRKGYEDHRLRKIDADFKPLSVLNKGDF